MARIGLYLAGGGARGAYQAGVLKALYDILQLKKLPFTMITGTSVGSLNAAILAEYTDDFAVAVEKLEALWRQISCDQIFKTHNYDVGKSLLRNMSGFFLKNPQPGYLLDTTPLHKFIDDKIDFNLIKSKMGHFDLEIMEVISHCYDTQQTVSFLQHNLPDAEDWFYARHISQHTDLNQSHLLASTALPLFFPVVKINQYHYGDGGMGFISPLRGATRFQMDKILILGSRQPPSLIEPMEGQSSNIGMAQILGNMLSGLFLDNLDRDIEMVSRMNDVARLLSLWKKRNAPWRPIEIMHLRPSQNVADIAQSDYQTMPTLLRMMLNMLGAQSHSGELLSFLLFEKEFTHRLIELGYQDTLANSTAILNFFE